jgi:hypothetical protein
MLTGDKVVLGPVRERDLAACIDAHTEISNRGAFFPGLHHRGGAPPG